MTKTFFLSASLLLLSLASVNAAETVLVRKTDGSWIEGATTLRGIQVGTRKIPLTQILSIHSGLPASEAEQARIKAGLAAVQGADRAARDQAVEELSAIGVPVLTPLLETYKDTDQHEPRPLYRLFERVMPSAADGFDRTQSLIRLRGGELLRGQVKGDALSVDGKPVDWKDVRLLAVRQRIAGRIAAPIHSLKHSTQIEFWDSGIIATKDSVIDVDARGFARLSFKEDGWASDPNGLTKPGSPAYKSHLWDGQPFGALVARAGSTGEVFFIGKSFHKTAPKPGRLQFAINDNRHWQNNLGTYTMNLKVSSAYDVGESQ